MNQLRTYALHILLGLLFVNGCVSQSSGSAVCKILDGLEGECRYRIDLVNLDVIMIKIDACDDPVSVTFTITNDYTGMDFSHTFKGSETIQLHGYTHETLLHVTTGETFSGLFRLEADIERFEKIDRPKTKTNFIYQDFDLRVAAERCFNIASKITVGVMSGLIVVAVAMGIVLLVFWRQKRKAERDCQRNSAGPSSSTAASQGTEQQDLQNGIANAAEMDNNNFDNNNTVNLNRLAEVVQNEDRNVNRAAETIDVGNKHNLQIQIPNCKAVLESGDRPGGDRNLVADSSEQPHISSQSVSDRHCTTSQSASEGHVPISAGHRNHRAANLELNQTCLHRDHTGTDLVSARNRTDDTGHTNTDSVLGNSCLHSTSHEDSLDHERQNNVREARSGQNRSQNHAKRNDQNDRNSHPRQGYRPSDNSGGGRVHYRTPAHGGCGGGGGVSSGADGGFTGGSRSSGADGGDVNMSYEHG